MRWVFPIWVFWVEDYPRPYLSAFLRRAGQPWQVHLMIGLN